MAGKRNERWEKEERRDRAALERILQREVDPELTIETFSWCPAPAGFEVSVTGQSQPLFVPFGQVVGEKNQLPRHLR